MNDHAPITNALTIDVEDYFHVGNFASTIPRATRLSIFGPH